MVVIEDTNHGEISSRRKSVRKQGEKRGKTWDSSPGDEEASSPVRLNRKTGGGKREKKKEQMQTEFLSRDWGKKREHKDTFKEGRTHHTKTKGGGVKKGREGGTTFQKSKREKVGEKGIPA